MTKMVIPCHLIPAPSGSLDKGRKLSSYHRGIHCPFLSLGDISNVLICFRRFSKSITMSSNHLEGLVGSDAKWDSIVSQGLLVKLSTREFTVLISIFTVAFAFLVARLFRGFSLLTFGMVIRERPNEHQMDQLRVAVVNFRTPFHVVGESITWRVIFRGRERERKFALAWLTGAIGFLLLGLSLPVLLSQFPVSNGE